MSQAVIYGPDYSTYVRTVRLCFEEKGAPYELAPVHILGGEAQDPAYLRKHPFAKVPAFQHDGLELYETDAIARYVDAVFPGKALQPADAKAAARMNQAVSIVNSYAYGAIVGKLAWQRLIVPMMGGAADESVIEASKPMVSRCLSEFERIRGNDRYLAGSEITLADLFLAPIFAYFVMTPEAADLLADHPGLQHWWSEISARPSMQATAPKMG
ncbi:glutathione S-transferase family protein [Alsobacter sp. KACC 23698]|uniref:glutathione transferase n=1 Tax=Alsobacter sp. KACC 23698 TaxID=3149229 RepID=A0AAU7JJ99_9HYPH